MHAKIAVLPGDGIGPEITSAAVKILDVIAKRFGHTFFFLEADIGGAAIDKWGNPFPQSTLEVCQSADSILLGAVGGPKWDAVPAEIRPERGLLALRKVLNLYANIRPVTVSPATVEASPLKREYVEGVDFIVVRELTGGIYFGDKTLTETHKSPLKEKATDLCTYTTDEVARVIRLAGELARSRNGRLTSVDKANVLETSRLWRKVATEVVREEFSDITFEHLLVDACAMHLIKRPKDFDVIVTENMFGDILTDEASVLAGSIGLLPSASLGDTISQSGKRLGLYEPIHGSAPDIAGKGIANPVGAILSGAMLLRYSLGLDEEADAVEKSVEGVLQAGVMTSDLLYGKGFSTHSVVDSVLVRLAEYPG